MKSKNLAKIVMASAIVIILIGLAHTAMSPTVYNQIINDNISTDKAMGLIYFFAVTGIAFSFCGIMMLYSAKSIGKNEKWGINIGIFSSLFILISGLTAIFYANFGNPLIYLMNCCGVINLVVLFVAYKRPEANLA